MTADELDAAWAELNVPTTSGSLAGRAPSQIEAGSGIHIAVDDGGLRHLVIPVEPGTDPPKTPETKGLDVSVDELKVGEQEPRIYLDVACRDAAMNANFSMVAAEILAALSEDSAAPAKTVRQILARWRWFWSAPPAGLSEEKMIGLFGELWFLEQWLGGASETSLAAWRGPFGGRHDFVTASWSVEVKGTRVRSDGAAKHRITTLDQLEDPMQGQLHLFSVRVRPDPVAANSLLTSIDRIRAGLETTPELLAEFDALIGRVGYSPAHRDKYATTFRVVAEELYEVSGDFPRLTPASFPNGVPGGIDDITYSLNLAACQDRLAAQRPADPVAVSLRDALDAE